MNKSELLEILKQEGIDPDSYDLDGGLLTEKYTLSLATNMLAFNDYVLADSVIVRFLAENTEARVTIVNWREEKNLLIFNDVIGFESLNCINVSLSHGDADATDSFLVRCCEKNEESPLEYTCFQFISAWTQLPVLKIVARSIN